MPKIPRARAIAPESNAASLPTSGFRGAVRVVDDDGTGNPGLAIWDVGISAYRIVTGDRLDPQESVLSMSFNDPTAVPAPSAGDRYIVAAGGVGAWTGHDDDIATYDGVQWDFLTPTEGTTCEVEDLDQFYTFNGAAWVSTPIFMGVAMAADFKTGRQAIGATVTSVAIVFGAAYADTSYSPVFSILNTIDVTPLHFTIEIIAKLATGFTVELSGPTDTVNYEIEWFAKHD